MNTLEPTERSVLSDPEADEPPPTAPPSLRQPLAPEAESPERSPAAEFPLPAPEGLDSPPGRAADTDSASARVYNQRNCDDDDARCLQLRNRIRRDALTALTPRSLDISPPYDPDADTPEEIAESLRARQERLASSGERQWKNHRGEVLATGQLVDLRDRRAIVKTADGTEQAIRVSDLAEDEVCFVAAWFNLPPECPIRQEEPFTGRQFVDSTFTWKSSGLCHKPLYFQETQLERYGHTAGPVLQPVISGAHFFANIATLPYHMGINPPNECQYVLGYYRPGNCAPWMIPPVPLSVRGGLAQAGTVVGLGAVLP
jgi:hypothetical protein